MTLLDNVNHLDRFELLKSLNEFAVCSSDCDTTERLRLLLEKAVLDEILKLSEIIASEKESYVSRQKYLSNQLALGIFNGYHCSYSGCRYQAERHRNLLSHFKRCHPNMKNIRCNFKNICCYVLSDVDSLLKHIKTDHSSTSTPANASPRIDFINIPCKCNRLSCDGVHFSNVGELMKHWNSFHKNEDRDCIFAECNVKFSSQKVGQNHFLLKHKKTQSLKLNSRHLFSNPSSVYITSVTTINDISPDTNQHVDCEEEEYCELDFDEVDSIDVREVFDVEEEATEEYYKLYYADFLNRLTNQKFIPQSTVSEIAEEYLITTENVLKSMKLEMRRSLDKFPNLDEQCKSEIIQDLVSNNKFLKAQESLNSEYKRTKFIQENMKYVAPIELILNKSDVKLGRKKDNALYTYHFYS